MTNKLVVIINSLKLPKIKKILLYEMKFLVPNYSCLQNPWMGVTAPWSPFSLPSVLNWICWTPPPNKIPGYATALDHRHFEISRENNYIFTFIFVNFATEVTWLKKMIGLLKKVVCVYVKAFYPSHCYPNKCRLDVSTCLEFQSHNRVCEIFGFHRGVIAVFAPLGFCNAKIGSLLPTFRNSVLAPSSRVNMS